MESDPIGYYRMREIAERSAAVGASCEQARWAHEQMAEAYARLVELEELKAADAGAAGKVVTIADALRRRDEAEYGRRSQRHRDAPAAPADRRT